MNYANRHVFFLSITLVNIITFQNKVWQFLHKKKKNTQLNQINIKRLRL